MKYRAMPNSMIVRRKARKEKKIGLIIVPENRMYKETICEVVSVGAEKVLPTGEHLYPDVNPGDKIHCLQYDGQELEPLDDPDLLQIDMEMAWCVIKRVPIDADETNCLVIKDPQWGPDA